MFGLLFVCGRVRRHGPLLALLCKVTRAVSITVTFLMGMSRHGVLITATEGLHNFAIAENPDSQD